MNKLHIDNEEYEQVIKWLNRMKWIHQEIIILIKEWKNEVADKLMWSVLMKEKQREWIFTELPYKHEKHTNR